MDSREGSQGNPNDSVKIGSKVQSLNFEYSDSVVAARLKRLGANVATNTQPAPKPPIKDAEFNDAAINERLKRLQKKIQEERAS